MTAVMLDVTSVSQIQEAVDRVDTLDVLINNAGIALYDDLSNFEVIEQHLAVNLLGLLKVTHAFLPLLKRSHGSIVNNLSLAGLAPLPVMPSCSISKAAAAERHSHCERSLRVKAWRSMPSFWAPSTPT